MIRRTEWVFSVMLALLGSRAFAADWPMYGQNLRRTFSAADSSPGAITPGNAMLLAPRWFFPTSDAITATPVVSAGTVYVGGWDGFFWALDARTGVPRWSFEVDCDPALNPGTINCIGSAGWNPVEKWPANVDRVTDDGGVITSSAAVAGVVVGSSTETRVFFGGGKTLYALDAASGALRWKRVICGNPERQGRPPDYVCEKDDADRTRIFASPAVFAGKVYVGTTDDGQKGYHGGVQAFDAVTGSPAWSINTDPVTVPDPKNPSNAIYRGCGGVWSSPAIDEARRLLYVGLADCNFQPKPPYSERLLAVDVDTGAIKLVMEPPGLANEQACDFDIGATANLFELAGTPIVGVGRKDGKYYEWNRVTGAYIRRLDSGVAGGVAGGFIGSTAVDLDSLRIVGATALGDTGGCFSDPVLPVSPQDPSVHGLKADGSGPDWHRYLNQSFGSSAVANGVMYVGTMLAMDFRVFNSATGDLLTLFPIGAAVSSGPAIADGFVYVGSGSSQDYNSAGVHAFALPTNLP